MQTVIKKSFNVMNESRKDKNLRGNEYRVYEYLASKAGNETAECFVLHSTVGGDLGIHVDTVRRVINRLIEKGYILKQMVKQRYTNNNSANIYTICAMLDEQSLKIKKKLVELFPVMKKGVHTVDEMIKCAIEKLYEDKGDDTVVEEPSEEVSEVEPTEDESEEVPVFVPSFKPSFAIDNDNDLEEDNSPCIETEEEASEESPKVSLKDKILSMFKDTEEKQANNLMPVAEEYGIIIDFDQMLQLVNRYGEGATLKGLHRAFAAEMLHYNYVRSYLESRYR